MTEFPRAPRDEAEREAFQFRAKANADIWCGRRKMDDRRIVLCTRFERHEGDHVACCEDGLDGRIGVVIARWPSTPSAPAAATRCAMPKLAEDRVDVDAELTVTFVIENEVARWSPKEMAADRVLRKIEDELWKLDMRRRALESARNAVAAQEKRRG